MNGDYEVDVHQILRAVDEADVLSIFFPLLRKSLIVDLRSNAENEPLVRVVPQAASMEERFRTIRRMRPQFPRPRRLIAVPWPKYVRSLVELGVVSHLSRRLAETGYSTGLKALRQALHELRSLERQELASVILGENYHTLWARRR